MELILFVVLFLLSFFSFASLGDGNSWKLIFAIVPPTTYCGGWAAFGVALAFIGGLTGVVGELATVLGCSMSLKPIVTAITIVALGTSLPDTFASRTAALSCDTADNAIGNITGSNAVNVFLGLGLPWLIGTCCEYSQAAAPPHTEGFQALVAPFSLHDYFCYLRQRRQRSRQLPSGQGRPCFLSTGLPHLCSPLFRDHPGASCDDRRTWREPCGESLERLCHGHAVGDLCGAFFVSLLILLLIFVLLLTDSLLFLTTPFFSVKPDLLPTSCCLIPLHPRNVYLNCVRQRNVGAPPTCRVVPGHHFAIMQMLSV